MQPLVKLLLNKKNETRQDVLLWEDNQLWGGNHSSASGFQFSVSGFIVV